VALVLLTGAACSSGPEPIRVGALYPLSGSQGPGGVEEYRGVMLAADLANRDGGVGGRPIEIEPVDVPGSDAVPDAMRFLQGRGIDLVVGSYGSTLSRAAAEQATERGMLFWETGAVGEMSGAGLGDLVFRVAPTGITLGRSGVAFIADQLAPMLGRDPSTLRFAVANVDDVYGQEVADGALAEIADRGYPLAGEFPYSVPGFDPAATVQAIAASHPDVLFVSAYLDDGVALREETIRQGLRLVASVGTSSAYCMPQFGVKLGPGAVGLFASDKPDADVLDPSGLQPEARDLLARARTAYEARYHEQMTAPALAGFSGAWVLFRHVLPSANGYDPGSVGRAARAADLPSGSLPNGSGLSFGRPGTPDAGANVRALSVIEEWVSVGRMVVVWPPAFATDPIKAVPILP
jgi:branched-chain amino acid transport system substrate-binding protein